MSGSEELSGSARFSFVTPHRGGNCGIAIISNHLHNPAVDSPVISRPSTTVKRGPMDSSMRAVTPRAAATATVQHCCEEHVSSERLESSVHGFSLLRRCICQSFWCSVQSAGGCVMHCFVAACAAAYAAAYAAVCADAYCSPPVRRAAMLCSLLPLCSYASPVLLRFVSTSTKMSRARSSPSTEQCAACPSAARRVAWMRARTHECAASGLAAPAP